MDDDLIFLEGYKSRKILRNGKTVDFRPLLPSDEFAYRNFFYQFERRDHLLCVFSIKCAFFPTK